MLFFAQDSDGLGVLDLPCQVASHQPRRFFNLANVIPRQFDCDALAGSFLSGNGQRQGYEVAEASPPPCAVGSHEVTVMPNEVGNMTNRYSSDANTSSHVASLVPNHVLPGRTINVAESSFESIRSAPLYRMTREKPLGYGLSLLRSHHYPDDF